MIRLDDLELRGNLGGFTNLNCTSSSTRHDGHGSRGLLAPLSGLIRSHRSALSCSLMVVSLFNYSSQQRWGYHNEVNWSEFKSDHIVFFIKHQEHLINIEFSELDISTVQYHVSGP